MRIRKYLSEDSINNIFDRFDNVVACEVDPKLHTKHGKVVGKILLLINMKYEKYKTEQIVEFYPDKKKWQSALIDGKCIMIINQHWIKLFKKNPKLTFEFVIQKTKLVGEKRIYYDDIEEIELSRSQYSQRRILEDLNHIEYKGHMAYLNFTQRYASSSNYYKSLNETAKHYRIPHEKLKKYFSEISHFKKKIKKEWTEKLLLYYQNDHTEKMISELFSDEKEENNVIEMKKQV